MIKIKLKNKNYLNLFIAFIVSFSLTSILLSPANSMDDRKGKGAAIKPSPPFEIPETALVSLKTINHCTVKPGKRKRSNSPPSAPASLEDATFEPLEQKEKRKKNNTENHISPSTLSTHPVLLPLLVSSEEQKLPPIPPKKNLFHQCATIAASPSVPISEIKEHKAKDEDTKGSRKWVRFFENPELSDSTESHNWHSEMKKIVTSFRDCCTSKVKKKDLQFPVTTNFAVARLTHVLLNETKPMNLEYFFASGFPARATVPATTEVSSSLFEQKLGEEFKSFKDYTIRFINEGYHQGHQKTEVKSVDFKEIKSILDKENKEGNGFIDGERLAFHSQMMSEQPQKIFAMKYFHSEQSIRMAVKEKIAQYKKAKPFINGYFIVDICSYNDMCWHCGDILASSCHTLEFGSYVYIRASGCNAYPPKDDLRTHRRGFNGYRTGIAFQKPANAFQKPVADKDYKPYIAHAVADDFT